MNTRPLPELQQAVEVLAHAANIMGDYDRAADDFVNALKYEHRTLQQGIVRLMIMAIIRYGKLDNSWVDPRNEAAWENCKKLGRYIEQGGLQHLPLI